MYSKDYNHKVVEGNPKRFFLNKMTDLVMLYSQLDTIKNGEYVWNYFTQYGSENHSDNENPMIDYKNEVLKNDYIEKDISIYKLINNDLDLKSFIKSENNFRDNWVKGRLVKNNIIIGDSSFDKDVVIDGYSRVFQSIINGDKKIKAFVPLKSKFNNSKKFFLNKMTDLVMLYSQLDSSESNSTN